MAASKPAPTPGKFISVRGAREHNLKGIDIDLPRDKLVVLTGLSGSGKSSLAFDTIYAEGQRRYVESLSAYARQFLEMMQKPDVDQIDGLSPAISIEQKTTSRNPRSTVGTVTEIYDYMRLLFARVGVPYSPATGLPIESQTVSQMVDRVLALPEGTRLYLLAPIVRGRKGEYRKELAELQKKGFQRIKIDGAFHEIAEAPALDKKLKHDLEVVVDRIVVRGDIAARLADSSRPRSNSPTASPSSRSRMPTLALPLPLKGGGRAAQPTGRGSGAAARVTPPRTFGPTLPFQGRGNPRCPKSASSRKAIWRATRASSSPRNSPVRSPASPSPRSSRGCSRSTTPTAPARSAMASAPSRWSTPISWCPTIRCRSAMAPWRRGRRPPRPITSRRWSRSPRPTSSRPPRRGRSCPRPRRTRSSTAPAMTPSRSTTTTACAPTARPRASKASSRTSSAATARPNSAWAREEIERFHSAKPCEACGGFRLKPEALAVKLDRLHISEVSQFSIRKALAWFAHLPETLTKQQNEIAVRILKEIRERLDFLVDVGLDYLTLARNSGTLSGGESQRIRLASQIGSGLTGVLYVLDEPSIGLHQRDNARLLDTLRHLRDLGNTVIVVEHDEDAIRQADYVVDIGPAAGIHGGHVVAEGTPDEVMANPASLTGQFLSGRRFISVPPLRRPPQKGKSLKIVGATGNNLKDVTAEIPLGLFTCVTGVSGSGKSTLTIDTLYRAVARKLNNGRDVPAAHKHIEGIDFLDKVIDIDQSPIGRTPRSNPATYTGAFTPIREWFSGLPEAKARGYGPGRFSFNVKGGRCEKCQGDGVIKIEMHFLPDVYVTCDVCQGKRYNRETLEVKFKGKSIADVLDMTVEEARAFFDAVPIIREKMETLDRVGLSYVHVGQQATTLSGGEAQRVKLSKELSRRATGRTLYILDEPTTGLHFADVEKLLDVLHELVDQGNTVVVIEHNLEVIKTADWILDLGPEGGDAGGEIVAAGPPEAIARDKRSYTGAFLKPVLAKARASRRDASANDEDEGAEAAE